MATPVGVVSNVLTRVIMYPPGPSRNRSGDWCPGGGSGYIKVYRYPLAFRGPFFRHSKVNSGRYLDVGIHLGGYFCHYILG